MPVSPFVLEATRHAVQWDRAAGTGPGEQNREHVPYFCHIIKTWDLGPGLGRGTEVGLCRVGAGLYLKCADFAYHGNFFFFCINFGFLKYHIQTFSPDCLFGTLSVLCRS